MYQLRCSNINKRIKQRKNREKRGLNFFSSFGEKSRHNSSTGLKNILVSWVLGIDSTFGKQKFMYLVQPTFV